MSLDLHSAYVCGYKRSDLSSLREFIVGPVVTPLDEVQGHFFRIEVKIGKFRANPSGSKELAKWDAFKHL